MLSGLSVELSLMSKCKFCKQPATQKFGLNYFCNSECAYNQIRALQAKKASKEASDQRKADRMRLVKLKTRSEWLRELQVVFNKFIRLRDKGLPCVSCQHPDDGSRQRHASHYKSVGGNPALRFEPNNCFASCSICNNYLSGNLVPYRVELIKRIGLAEVERLEGPQEPLKLTIPEIQELIKVYKQRCKELQSVL